MTAYCLNDSGQTINAAPYQITSFIYNDNNYYITFYHGESRGAIMQFEVKILELEKDKLTDVTAHFLKNKEESIKVKYIRGNRGSNIDGNLGFDDEKKEIHFWGFYFNNPKDHKSISKETL